MAVTVGPPGQRLFQGVAADTKPIRPAADINDVFFEKDTTKYYLFDGLVWTYTGTISAAPPMR